MQLDGQLRTLIRKLVHEGVPLRQACREFERKYIEEALQEHDGSMSRAAAALGIHRNTLYNRLRDRTTERNGKR